MSPSVHAASESSTETTRESVTQTVILDLETSRKKLEKVRDGITAYQQVAEYMSSVLPSYPESEWEPINPHMHNHAKRALPDDRKYKTTLSQAAKKKVATAYKSWLEKGKPGDYPQGDFGDSDHLRLRGDTVIIDRNDRGWGLKTKFIAHDPVWFHIDDDQFQREYLTRITDPDDPASSGSAELHLSDDDTLRCHLTVSWPVEVYEPGDVETVIGVDLNDHPMAVAAVIEDDAVNDVEFVSGREFRHHRERLKNRAADAMEVGNLEAAKNWSTYSKYSDQETHTCSRQIVDLAASHAPAVIVLEDLTHYRETAKDPIHDWPFAKLQEQIAYKATEAGLPVEFIDPRNTSVTCRKCGHTDERSRDGDRFHCTGCGYTVHADLNAAVNIAERWTQSDT